MSWLRSTMYKELKESQNKESLLDFITKLEEVFISCNGKERLVFLRRLLISLKQIEGIVMSFTSEDNLFEPNDDGLKNETSHLVSYFGIDNLKDARWNLWDVIIIHSQLVESVVLSMILEPPSEEEITLVLEIFRLTLMGDREVHDALIRYLQKLAKVFSSYHEEVLLRREELLNYAQIAIRGLKVNSNMKRIDMEVSTLVKKMRETKIKNCFTGIEDIQKNNVVTMEMYLKLVKLLLNKKAIRDGDSLESHAQKVSKLKILLESTTKSTLKAERCILDHRFHKDEALRFRSLKAEVDIQVKKGIEVEIETLGKQKNELEVALRKVNASLIIAKIKIRNVREEKKHFEEASNVFLQDLHLKEEELSKSINSSKSETKIVILFTKFVEDAWNVQLAISQLTQKQNIAELNRHSAHHAKIIIDLLDRYKVKLEIIMNHFRIVVRQLKSNEEPNDISHLEEESFPIPLKRTILEEEYLDLEDKLKTAFCLVDKMKHSNTQSEYIPRSDEKSIKELFSIFEKVKMEFQSLKRPSLQSLPQKEGKWQGITIKLKAIDDSKKNDFTQIEYNKGTQLDWHSLGLEEGTPHSESTKRSKNHFRHDSIDWEFDALGN